MTAERNKWLVLAESLARDVLAKHAQDVDVQGRWPAESVAALAGAGLLGLHVPQTLGGAGEGPRTFVALTTILAQHCASTAMIYLMHVCATQIVVATPSFGLRDEVIGATAAGRHLGTLAISEKGSRSHFWAPISQVVVEGNDHCLSAEKSFVTSAGKADGYIVSTRSLQPKALTDSTLYWVRRDTPGLRVRGTWNGLGLRGNGSAPMNLDHVVVPPSHRIGDDGAGFPMMMQFMLPWFQLGSAAVSVGLARAATTGIRQHLLASKLEHLGGPALASLPNLRAQLARMQIAVDTQQAFLERVVDLVERPRPETLLGLLECKAAAAEVALEVTDLAMRTGGGACFSKQMTVERNFRDARAGAVMAPTTDVLYDFIGRTLLEMPLL